MHTLDPNALSLSERYKLLIGCVTPRPIAFISTCDATGRSNLAPYSFFNAVAASPMSLMFCPAAKDDGSDKDTLRNCLPPEEGGRGEFVVNVAIEGYARQMAATAHPLPHGQSEFQAAGFTEAACHTVAAPRVAESPVSFECHTTHVLRLDPHAPLSGNLVIGKVVHIWIDPTILDERLRVDADKLATIARMGGRSYCRSRERFALDSGLASLKAEAPFPEDVGTGRALYKAGV